MASVVLAMQLFIFNWVLIFKLLMLKLINSQIIVFNYDHGDLRRKR